MYENDLVLIQFKTAKLSLVQIEADLLDVTTKAMFYFEPNCWKELKQNAVKDVKIDVDLNFENILVLINKRFLYLIPVKAAYEESVAT